MTRIGIRVTRELRAWHGLDGIMAEGGMGCPPPPTTEAPDCPEHPWPYLSSLFALKQTKENSYLMSCLLCQPKPVVLSVYKINSASNLRKHIAVSCSFIHISPLRSSLPLPSSFIHISLLLSPPLLSPPSPPWQRVFRVFVPSF